MPKKSRAGWGWLLAAAAVAVAACFLPGIVAEAAVPIAAGRVVPGSAGSSDGGPLALVLGAAVLVGAFALMALSVRLRRYAARIGRSEAAAARTNPSRT